MLAPRWRVWTYEQPALVLGCSQRLLYERLMAGPGDPPIEVLLRESGGGAVLTGPWLVSLSLVLPPHHPWLGQGLPESYRHLGQVHADALADEGLAVKALPPPQIVGTQASLAARGLPALDWACFGSLGPWELVDAQGRKLVGLAQRRRASGALLVAGTLVAEPDWGLLCDALGRPDEAAWLRQRTASCGRLLGRAWSSANWSAALSRRLALALTDA